MKFVVSSMVVLLLFSCNNNNTSSETLTNKSNSSIPSGKTMQQVYEDSSFQDVWIDTLSSINFIQKSNAYIDSFSNHKHGIAFLADSTNKDELIYSAGYNGPDRFETYYQFYIYPATKTIMVYDPVKNVKRSLGDYNEQIN